jgi:hypothetical protein
MVCKADTRCILVQAECPYVQCSLLLVLLCTEVLVVGDTSWSREGWLLGLCVWMCSSAECVCLEHYNSVVLSCRATLWLRVPPSPFISCKGRGRVIVFGCTKNRKRMP